MAKIEKNGRVFEKTVLGSVKNIGTGALIVTKIGDSYEISKYKFVEVTNLEKAKRKAAGVVKAEEKQKVRDVKAKEAEVKKLEKVEDHKKQVAKNKEARLKWKFAKDSLRADVSTQKKKVRKTLDASDAEKLAALELELAKLVKADWKNYL